MKLLLVCSQGGHFATMTGLRKFWSAHPREWVTHHSSDTAKLISQEVVHYLPNQKSRSILATILNFFLAFRILWRARPDMIVTTGAAVGVSFIFAGRLLGIRSIFVDSISRVNDLSLSARLVYPLISEVYVQWESCGKHRAKAHYEGAVF